MVNLQIKFVGKMSINIRKAVAKDCPRLLELIHELAVYERAPEQVTVTLEHFIESGFGSQPVWWAYVAEETSDTAGPLVLGFALYYIRYSTWKGQAMYLEDILITNEMRGKGIGKLLFDRLIEEARDKKFNRIIWQVLDWNEPAIRFYKKYEAGLEAGWLNASLSTEQILNNQP
jgi:GNAT superfamily N-acetyltransferase